jgi:hypothetical protein
MASMGGPRTKRATRSARVKANLIGAGTENISVASNQGPPTSDDLHECRLTGHG